MTKFKIIDLFAGCGGLMEGFEKSHFYEIIAAVEWDKAPCLNLLNRLKNKWNYRNANEIVLNFDIQRTEELLNGWENDIDYGTSKGLNYLVNNSNGIDIIIGGPPCQAYSLAGRISDQYQMKKDYRNYLFEKYLEIVKQFRPKLIVFENVPGMLSANPNGIPISSILQESFSALNYIIPNDLKSAIIDFTQYGVPQNRKRVILIGLNKDYFGSCSEKYMNILYNDILPKYKSKRIFTVKDTISDLPKLFPLNEDIKLQTRKTRHSIPDTNIKNHIARWHNDRDLYIFKILTEDIAYGINQYQSTDSLKKLYTELTGKISNVHKYHVIRWDSPSNLIPAHLYKDGLRHIHPDPNQIRTITVREAARLQTFADDYEFIGSNSAAYKMIGNAVPPRFSLCLAKAINEFLVNYSPIK